jgi:small neutral amino acid transporter SnatA (MarC family)
MNPIEKTAHTAVYGGSGTAIYFGLSANELAAFGGLIIAGIGLLVTWYFQRKRDRREQAEHDRKMGLYEQ